MMEEYIGDRVRADQTGRKGSKWMVWRICQECERGRYVDETKLPVNRCQRCNTQSLRRTTFMSRENR